jgi:hypothetical protein
LGYRVLHCEEEPARKPRKDTSAITRRAYLLTDQTIEAAATYHADLRPPLDAVSRQAIEDQDPHPERAVVPPDPDTTTTDSGGDGPDTLLWVALMLAPPDGTAVPDLMAETGMSRPWIYLRLRDLRLHRRPRRMTFVRYPDLFDQKLKAGAQIRERSFLGLTLAERGNARTELGGRIPADAVLILLDDVGHVNDIQRLKGWGLCLVGHGRRACVTAGEAGFRPVS